MVGLIIDLFDYAVVLRSGLRATEARAAPDKIAAYLMLKFVSKRVHLILFAGLLALTPGLASADVSVTVAPPPIPVYDQPPCPADGYLWVPGYWSYGDDDYYWVPGVWVEPPEVGFLWTPGWWGFDGGAYLWHVGYWGPLVGFYGGINYGFGYFGTGFWGGHWDGGHFFYNTACWHVGGNIHNTYSNRTGWAEEHNRASFNGPGGIDRKATAEEERANREGHHDMTEGQRAHEHDAVHDHNQKFSENKGHPEKTSVSKTAHEGEHHGEQHHAEEHHGTVNKGAEHHGTEHHAEQHGAEHHAPEHHAPEHHAPEHHAPEHHAPEHHAPEHHAPPPKKGGNEKKK